MCVYVRDWKARADLAGGASALITAACKEIQRLRTVNEQLIAAQPACESSAVPARACERTVSQALVHA